MSFTLSPSETRALYRYLTVGVDALSASEMDLVVLLNIRLKKAFEEKPHWRRDCEPLSKRLTSW